VLRACVMAAIGWPRVAIASSASTLVRLRFAVKGQNALRAQTFRLMAQCMGGRGVGAEGKGDDGQRKA
jgi:hypothetical protein